MKDAEFSPFFNIRKYGFLKHDIVSIISPKDF